MSAKEIIKLYQTPVTVAGGIATPMQDSNHSYSDEVLGLSIGTWDSCNLYDIARTDDCDKLITIIEGSLTVKNNLTGKTDTILAGESIVVHQGSYNSYHQKGNFYAVYVSYQSNSRLKGTTNNILHIHNNSEIPWQETSDGNRKKVLYQTPEQRFTVGIWQSKQLTTGLINFPYHEFIFINQGNLVCIDEMGVTHHFNRGDVLFIPQGTSCAWQIKNKISLYFAQIK